MGIVDLFDDGKHDVFVIPAQLGLNIIGKTTSKLFFILGFDSFKTPLNWKLFI